MPSSREHAELLRTCQERVRVASSAMHSASVATTELRDLTERTRQLIVHTQEVMRRTDSFLFEHGNAINATKDCDYVRDPHSGWSFTKRQSLPRRNPHLSMDSLRRKGSAKPDPFAE